MLTMFVRALVLYVLVILLMRLMGKRQIGQLQPFELVFTVIIADLAATPMSDVGIPLLYGVLPMAALMLCYAIFSLLVLKCEKARELLSGRPTILVKDGVIDQKAMEKQGFTIPALMEQVRERGIQNLSEVGCAVLEISGQVNVFPIAAKRNVTPEDLDLHPAYENLPLHLILDGKLQADSLHSAGLNADWLRQQLHRFKLGIENTYFCSLDTDGVICAQKKQEKRVHFAQALKPEEARW